MKDWNLQPNDPTALQMSLLTLLYLHHSIQMSLLTLPHCHDSIQMSLLTFLYRHHSIKITTLKLLCWHFSIQMSILTLPPQYTHVITDIILLSIQKYTNFPAPHVKLTWNNLLLLPSAPFHYRSSARSSIAWTTDGSYQKYKQSKPGDLQEFF